MEETTDPTATEQPSDGVPFIERRTSGVDLAIFLFTCVIASLLIAVVRWTTFLGVSALPWLHQGHDFPWRVWWRARTRYVNANHHLPLYLVMGGALAIVFVGTGLICWLLLTHTDDDPTVPLKA
jgi:hypothetical protein